MQDRIRNSGSETEQGSYQNFVPYFETLFTRLQTAKDNNSDIEIQKVSGEICNYLRDFWTGFSQRNPKDPASFGRNENGTEQIAFSMKNLDDVETSICMWGYEVDKDGNKMPKIEIFTVPYKSQRNAHGLLESDHQYKINLDYRNLTIKKTDWKAKDKHTIISVPLETKAIVVLQIVN